MAITLTGNKYTGTLTSVGTAALTDSGASFSSGDFNTPRMAYLYRSGDLIGLARVSSFSSATVLNLAHPFFDYDGDEVTQVSGDTYYISQTAGEVATTGWAVSGLKVTITDKVLFGTAGSKTSLFLHMEDTYLDTNVGGSNSQAAFEGQGGCVTFGNPLDLKNRKTSSECRVYASTTSAGHLMCCKNTAFTQIHFGTQFAVENGNTGRMPGGASGGGFSPGWWQVFVNCAYNGNFVTPGGGAAWSSRASLQRLINLQSSGNSANLINSRWADGYFEGGVFDNSLNGGGLSCFGADSAGTYAAGAVLGQRLAVFECPDNRIWRSLSVVNQTINFTNILVEDANKLTRVNVASSYITTATLNFRWLDKYTNLSNGTKYIVKNNVSSVVASGTVGASGETADIDLLYQTRTFPSTTTTSDTFFNGWEAGFYKYGQQIIFLEPDVFDDTQAGKTVKNIAFGGPLAQSVDTIITEPTKATVDAYTTIDDAYELYDRAASYLEDNYDNETATIINRVGDQADLAAVDLVIDATAASAFAYSATGDGTITVKSSEFTGGATSTTGEVTLSNGALLNGGTFRLINIDNNSDGDTYTNLTASKIVHSGTGTRTLTLDGGDVDEIEVTGGADLTVTLTNGAAIPTLTQTLGTITIINNMTVNVTGLTIGDTVRVQDNTGAQQEYTTATGTSYQFTISRADDGESWKVAVDRAGYAPDVSTFTVAEGTTLEINVSLNEYIRFEGDAMYTGTTCPLCTVSFDLVTPQATIDIGDGVADLQAIFDEVEDALLTSDGMAWHSQQGSVTKYDNLPGVGKVLGLGENWRVRRENAGDVNAGVNGYLLSEDGTPIDGTNGDVVYLSSTATDIATILANTNRVDGLIEDSGGDRYTAKALEEAPSGGGGGLTQQEVRDAMKLAPTAGVPAIDSLDDKLDELETQVATRSSSVEIAALKDFDPAVDEVITNDPSRKAARAKATLSI